MSTEFWYKKQKGKFRIAIACSEDLKDVLGVEEKSGYYRVSTPSLKEVKKIRRWLKKTYPPVAARKRELPPKVNRVVQNDCLDGLKELPDNFIDVMVTDPPYALTPVNPRTSGGGKGNSGFMGKRWDRAVPSVEVWKECLRVLKPGAFGFVMCTPRQDCLARMIVNLEDAGFVTGFTSLYWTYATGFCKGQNLSKAADKRVGAKREVVGRYQPPNGTEWNLKNDTARSSIGAIGHTDRSASLNITVPATEEARSLSGAFAGLQMKPAVEVVLCVMKPLEHKTYLDQALDNGKGCTWLDDGRIPIVGDTKGSHWTHRREIGDGNIYGGGGWKDVDHGNKCPTSGRFPANLLVEDDAFAGHGFNRGDWARGANTKAERGYGGGFGILKNDRGFKDDKGGSFSRYFDLDAWWENRVQNLPDVVQRVFPFLIVPKTAKKEKNAGLAEGTTCTHPSVKPIKLLSYLTTIGSRPGDIVLDPYLGSGSTGVAAITLKRRFLGFEKEDEYIPIARQRIKHAKAEMKKEPAPPSSQKSTKKMKPLFKKS